jgi:hypothetical protein
MWHDIAAKIKGILEFGFWIWDFGFQEFRGPNPKS